MNKLLKTIKNAKLELLKFKNHPVNILLDDDKIEYFNGLSLVENIRDSKKSLEYFKVLLLSMDLDKNTDFSKKNEFSEKEFTKIIEIISKNSLSLTFLLDFTILAFKKDEKLKTNDKNMLKTFMKFLKINQSEFKNIEKLAKSFIKNDKDQVFKIIDKNYKSESKTFDYLVEYYGE